MTDSENATAKSMSRHIARGSAWMVGMRWVMRSIGLVSTAILARLLMPEDFGIVAMATVIVGLFDVFTFLGVDLALIRNREAERAHYDTAWTIGLIQKAGIALILVIASPLAGLYFDEPRVVPAIWVLALAGVIGGLGNIGVVDFRKELNFARDFQLGVLRKGLGFFVIVGLAFWLRSYWALILGTLFRSIIGVVLTYAMHPYRPRFSLEKFRDIWSFSQWLLFFHVGRFLTGKIDRFVIGAFGNTAALGVYHVADYATTSFTNELVVPMGRAAFPSYARLTHAPSELAASYRQTLAFIALLCIPAGLGISAVAGDLVTVLLTDKFAQSVPVVEWLGLFGAAAGLTFSAFPLILAAGSVKRYAQLTWGHLIVLSAVFVIVMGARDITQIAMVRALIGTLYVGAVFLLVTRILPLGFAGLVAAVIRPVLAGAVMFAIIKVMDTQDLGAPIVALTIKVIAGAAIYGLTLIALWFVSGRPDGPERTVLAIVTRKLSRQVVTPRT